VRHRTIGEAFNGRSNALNFLRLVFAALVLVDHVHIGAGFCVGTACNTTNQVGSAGVDGFFAASGFLIAGSALKYQPLRYLWHRCLRILPGYWTCLLVLVMLGAVTAHAAYWTSSTGPVFFLVHNFDLRWQPWVIAGTPSGVPFPWTWDASLWTLWWEFGCYLFVGVLAAAGILRRRDLFLCIAAPTWAVSIIGEVNGQSPAILRFAAIFMAGTAIYLYRDRIPDSRILAATGLVGAAAGFAVHADALLGVCVAYPTLWTAAHLPVRIGSRNDLSYGLYIYGWPVMQMLLMAGAATIGYWLLLPTVFLATLPVAAISWLLVERPAMRLKAATLRGRRNAEPSDVRSGITSRA
jgi:peptidoglycan/LPS O-acetylase OafA/YrhL